MHLAASGCPHKKLADLGQINRDATKELATVIAAKAAMAVVEFLRVLE